MKKYSTFLLGMIVAGALFALGATIGVKMYSVMSLTSADVSATYPGTGNFLINAGVTISGTGSATPGTAGLLQTMTSEKNVFSKSNGGQQLTVSALGITYGTNSSQFGYPKAATYLTQQVSGCTLWNNVNVTSCIRNSVGWSTLTLSGCSVTPILPMATVVDSGSGVSVVMTGTTQLNIRTYSSGSISDRDAIITVFCQ